jgi:hypothetical protein
VLDSFFPQLILPLILAAAYSFAGNIVPGHIYPIYMLLPAEQKITDRPKEMRKISPRYAAGFATQPGKTGVVKAMPVKFERKQPGLPSGFSGWTMPEQEAGVIKCREHDFL